jgi:AcrR family transcriptional regulator
MARQPAPGTRDRILDVATRLFYEHGTHDVGLQRVIDECGCGKNLLYREFASKDDLVVAYLAARSLEWKALVERATRPFPADPTAQLVAIVRILAEDAAAPEFRGCPFLKASAEFPDPDHPAHRAAVAHYQALRAQLRELAEQARAVDPDALADRLMLIIQGLAADGVILPHQAATALAFAEDIVAIATQRLTPLSAADRGHR